MAISASATEPRQRRTNWNPSVVALVFISTTIRNAVDLGTLWRFPYVAQSYGSAFLIPYLAALFLVGIPIYTLEYTLRLVHGSSDVASFAAMHPCLGGLGLGHTFCDCMINTYSVIISAWALHYLILVFQMQKKFGWTNSVCSEFCFFSKNFVDIVTDTPGEGDIKRAPILMPIIAYVAAIYTVVLIFVFKGGKFSKSLTNAPAFVAFFIFVFFVLYIFELDAGPWSKELHFWGCFESKEVWADAVGQVFFSVRMALGRADASSSLGIRRRVLQTGSFAFGNVLGCLLFSILFTGAEKVSAASTFFGFGPVFVTMPALLTFMGRRPILVHFQERRIIAVAFFAIVVLLGAGSALSWVEGSITRFRSARAFKNWSKQTLCVCIVLVCFLISLKYANRVGVFFLDCADYYTSIGLLFVGLIEAIGAGWIVHWDAHEERIGRMAQYAIMATFFSALLAIWSISVLGSWFVEPEHRAGMAIVGGAITFAVGTLMACKVAAQHQKVPLNARVVYDVLLYNVEELWNELNAASTNKHGNFTTPFWWVILLKFFIPLALCICLWVKLSSPEFCNFRGYPPVVQRWGVFVGLFPWLVIFLGFLLPQFFQQLLPEHQLIQGTENTSPAPVVVGNSERDEV